GDYYGYSNGNDTVYGGDGNDQLFGDNQYGGGNGNDVLYGDAGDDTLYGHDGNNTLFGGDGNDRLFGCAGIDNFYGGPGDETINWNNDGVADGGTGSDTITISNLHTGVIASANGNLNGHLFAGFEVISGITGTNGDDSIDASGWTVSGLSIYGYDGN